MDVTKIVLTEEEQILFNKFRKTDHTELTVSEYKILLHKSLIKDHIGGNSGWFSTLPQKGVCEISDIGKDLRAYQLLQKKADRRSSRRYWITTGIAIAALLLSIAALLWQAYIWKYELKHNEVTFSSSDLADSISNEAQGALQSLPQEFH